MIMTDIDNKENENIIETDAQTAALEQSDNNTAFDLEKDAIAVKEDKYSVYELVRQAFEKKKFILDPDFQRNLVWKQEQKSRFIESILLNFPIPPVYLNENIEGKYIVIDGRQRISTLIEFLKGELKR
jgi:hypothetical protein